MVESDSTSDATGWTCSTVSVYMMEGATCSGVITELLNGKIPAFLNAELRFSGLKAYT